MSKPVALRWNATVTVRTIGCSSKLEDETEMIGLNINENIRLFSPTLGIYSVIILGISLQIMEFSHLA